MTALPNRSLEKAAGVIKQNHVGEDTIQVWCTRTLIE
jgi:hypothetical protein